jgi:hypothetical protein
MGGIQQRLGALPTVLQAGGEDRAAIAEHGVGPVSGDGARHGVIAGGHEGSGVSHRESVGRQVENGSGWATLPR